MEVVSIHVPKTAGITFRKILEQVYGPEQVFKDYNGRDIREIGPAHRVVHGHFSVARYHGLFPEARRIAWIRNPVAWVISLYYYTKHIEVRPDNPLACRMARDGMTLLEFAEHPLTRNNYANVWLYGLPLEEFFFIGIQESFQDELCALGRMLNWREVVPAMENANPEPGYAAIVRDHLADRKLVRTIESYFDRDMDLYAQALRMRARRNRRIDAGGPAYRQRGVLGAIRSVLPRSATGRS